MILFFGWFYISSHNFEEVNCSNVFTQLKETRSFGNFLCRFEKEGLKFFGSSTESVRLLFWVVVILLLFVFLHLFVNIQSHNWIMYIFWIFILFIALVMLKII